MTKNKGKKRHSIDIFAFVFSQQSVMQMYHFVNMTLESKNHLKLFSFIMALLICQKNYLIQMYLHQYNFWRIYFPLLFWFKIIYRTGTSKVKTINKKLCLFNCRKTKYKFIGKIQFNLKLYYFKYTCTIFNSVALFKKYYTI